MNVALGARDEDTLTSLANRVIRLSSKLTPEEHKEFKESVGISASNLAQNLLDAFDEDVIAQRAGVMLSDDGRDLTEEEIQKLSLRNI